MSKIVVSIIGNDRPGVIYTISAALSSLKCNIEEVSQTVLKNQFAAIFVASKPEDMDDESICSFLTKAIHDKGMQLTVTVRVFEETKAVAVEQSEPFVVTVDGTDRLEIISSISRILSENHVNIDSLKAIMPDEEQRLALLVFEISLPLSIDRNALRRTLQDRAKSLGLRLSMQHRDIFEAVHRVLPV